MYNEIQASKSKFHRDLARSWRKTPSTLSFLESLLVYVDNKDSDDFKEEDYDYLRGQMIIGL